MILLALHVMASIGGALMQEGCDIIGLTCDGINRRGSYAGRLCNYWPFMLWCQ